MTIRLRYHQAPARQAGPALLPEDYPQLWLPYGGLRMIGQKNMGILLGFMLSACLIASSVTAAVMAGMNNRTQFQLLGSVCGDILEENPELEQTLLPVIKGIKKPARIGRKSQCAFGLWLPAV